MKNLKKFGKVSFKFLRKSKKNINLHLSQTRLEKERNGQNLRLIRIVNDYKHNIFEHLENKILIT